jgi:Cu/Ag efflux pump CusA
LVVWSATVFATTLAVVNAVKQALVVARQAAPAGMQIKELFDQSVFVKASIQGLLKEGAIAACLTALMILLFLGSWRSTLVVMISIPLAILSSLIVLYFLGDTINTMTLGGLALAIGILVDDSTVTIENTHRLLTEERMPLPAATLHGAAGIAVPTLVSTLAISCVFVSVVFLHGPAKYLFTPGDRDRWHDQATGQERMEKLRVAVAHIGKGALEPRVQVSEPAGLRAGPRICSMIAPTRSGGRYCCSKRSVAS